MPHRVIADGDLVVVEATGRNITVEGRPYENHYCFVIRMESGRMRKLTEYMDTALVGAVLGPLTPSPSGRMTAPTAFARGP